MELDGDPVIVVLTALGLEHAAVRRLLSGRRRVDHPSGTLFEVGHPPRGRFRIALAVTGEGNTAAAVLAERSIALFRPAAIVFVGVAGALREDLAFGDVVVATKIYAYHGGKVQPGGFEARPRSWELSHRIDQLARRVAADGTWSGPVAETPAVHLRPIAAGEVVLNSRDDPLSAQLRHHYGDAVAIEMESAGVAHAAHLNDALPVLTVRGISDRADGHKHEADEHGWQPVAAANAAAFALAVIAELTESQDTSRRHQLPVGAAVPRQLPARGGVLHGRAVELAELDTILLGSDRGGPRIAVITGTAGAGKTALALEWAHTTTEAFPDGQLHVDGRGFGPDTPLPTREILAGFLRALGQSRAAEQGDLDERAARFRTAINGRRMLLVLDNVREPAQIRPLLPGTGDSAVLITSRQRLHGLAVHHPVSTVELDRLSRDESVGLLSDVLGARADANPEAVARLVEHCAGLPLALRIAAEMAATRSQDSVATLLAELEQNESALDFLDLGDDPYAAVRSVFSWSYVALSESSATAFRRLGLHPGNAVSLPVAAAMLDTTIAAARRTLRRLADAHLITEPGPGCFAMHDLLRAYARDLGLRLDEPADRAATTDRMVDQYLHTADRAGRLVMPHRHRLSLAGRAIAEPAFADRAAALDWYERERRNLTEVFSLESAGTDRQRWQLAYVLRDFFYLTKHVDSWVRSHTVAVESATRLADRRAEGITRNNLGRALLESGREAEAEEQYRSARDLLRAAGDDQGAVDAQVNVASILRRRGAYEEALGHLNDGLAVYRRTQLPRKVGITLRSIARTEVEMGRPADAARHAREALAVFAELGLELDMAQTLNTLTRIHLAGGDADAARSMAERAVDRSRSAGSDYERAHALRGLGWAAALSGDKSLARTHLQESLAILQQLGATAADKVKAELDDLT
ncbi:tetratricopeptide repeat protein [Actinoplanes bogorensis]|uniref:Tetratricopeptide repeat protein n=1 Tax=Paractinoplanes bogorensis TaxID=1610840 RepID=A0ABS5YNU9_9ACTN|nr:tetratricopeptide repeat protein [Actinoplanes bogorensis]MBU2665122.1 tetratricopeptide repeat protein [Actinoplanes bogorensis]